MDGSISERLGAAGEKAGERVSEAGDRLSHVADRLGETPGRLAETAQAKLAGAQKRLQNAPGWFDRHKAKFAGFATGLVVPLVILSLFTVSYRGYGFGENPPQPAQVYTAF